MSGHILKRPHVLAAVVIQNPALFTANCALLARPLLKGIAIAQPQGLVLLADGLGLFFLGRHLDDLGDHLRCLIVGVSHCIHGCIIRLAEPDRCGEEHLETA